jgi:hypothetical protein
VRPISKNGRQTAGRNKKERKYNRGSEALSHCYSLSVWDIFYSFASIGYILFSHILKKQSPIVYSNMILIKDFMNVIVNNFHILVDFKIIKEEFL